MYTVYALQSVSRNYVYVGISDNLARRLEQHNRGYNRTTRPYAPFKVLYTEQYETRTDARKREKYLKSGVGKEFLKSRIA